MDGVRHGYGSTGGKVLGMTYGTEITDNDKRELFIINQKQEVTKMDVKDITKAVSGDSIAKAVDKAVDAVADKIPVSKSVKDDVKKEVKKVATKENIEKVATKENIEKVKDVAGKVIDKVKGDK